MYIIKLEKMAVVWVYGTYFILYKMRKKITVTKSTVDVYIYYKGTCSSPHNVSSLVGFVTNKKKKQKTKQELHVTALYFCKVQRLYSSFLNVPSGHSRSFKCINQHITVKEFSTLRAAFAFCYLWIIAGYWSTSFNPAHHLV